MPINSLKVIKIKTFQSYDRLCVKSIILTLMHLLILLCGNYVFLCKLQEYRCSVCNQNLFSLNACTVKVYFAACILYSSIGIFQFSGFNVNDSECKFCVTHVSI